MVWNTHRHIGSEEDYTIDKEALNQVISEIRNSKRSYEQKIALNVKHDSKGFYLLSMTSLLETHVEMGYQVIFNKKINQVIFNLYF